MGIEKTRWRGRPAFRLTDGRSEAIVVPGIGCRLVHFGAVGGTNWLWNGPAGKAYKANEWRNWGGEKVWPAPQSAWGNFLNPAWPPHPTWDQGSHAATVLGDSTLAAVGPPMAGFGIRARRKFGFDKATGALIVATTFRKESGEPRQVAVWNVVQLKQPDAVYVRRNPESPYVDGVYWFQNRPPAMARVETVGELLKYRPTADGGYKAGFDSPSGSIVAVKGEMALRLRAKRIADKPYPEGAEGCGFPLTAWNNGGSESERYTELESMSPLAALKVGQSLTHTIRLSLHPASDDLGVLLTP